MVSMYLKRYDRSGPKTTQMASAHFHRLLDTVYSQRNPQSTRTSLRYYHQLKHLQRTADEIHQRDMTTHEYRAYALQCHMHNVPAPSFIEWLNKKRPHGHAVSLEEEEALWFNEADFYKIFLNVRSAYTPLLDYDSWYRDPYTTRARNVRNQIRTKYGKPVQ
jgi:hypothetical protein